MRFNSFDFRFLKTDIESIVYEIYDVEARNDRVVCNKYNGHRIAELKALSNKLLNVINAVERNAIILGYFSSPLFPHTEQTSPFKIMEVETNWDVLIEAIGNLSAKVYEISCDFECDRESASIGHDLYCICEMFKEKIWDDIDNIEYRDKTEEYTLCLPHLRAI